jgi:GNAT superfamily N-acetyltransferase
VSPARRRPGRRARDGGGAARGIELSVETAPDAREIEALAHGLTAHALPITRRRGFEPLAVFARDAEGALVGGVSGLVNWTWLHISLFWVSDALRRQGLGSRLLASIEAAALARGCTQAHLDTFSYQARPFYERHGYSLFATLEDYPPGHQRFFLRKRLGAHEAGGSRKRGIC